MKAILGLTALLISTAVMGSDAALSFPSEEARSDETATRAGYQLRRFALEKRIDWSQRTFEDFSLNGAFREPGADGVFIVNGDTPITTEAELREFWERSVLRDGQPSRGSDLILNAPNGVAAPWSATEKLALSYCIDKSSFAGHYEKVVADMAAASRAWESVSNVKFSHMTQWDGRCNAATSKVMFNVSRVSSGRYLARAFFPGDERRYRNVMIDNSALSFPVEDTLQLVGVLRHELGHVLGWRHEHTRPESGDCFEDSEWVPVGRGNYDAFSVMHYPQCNGRGDWSLTITSDDAIGAACVYGPADGQPFDNTQCISE